MEKKDIDKILFSFLETSYLFEKSEEKTFGLTWQEIYLLQLLKKDGPSSINSLGSRLYLEKYQITRLVKRLEEKQKITRNKSENDARIILITITEDGINSIDEIEKYHFKLFQKNQSEIKESEITGVIDALQKFASLAGILPTKIEK